MLPYQAYQHKQTIRMRATQESLAFPVSQYKGVHIYTCRADSLLKSLLFHLLLVFVGL